MSRILYVQTSGLDTPERLYAPFILGATARAMEVEASIFFMIKGITAMKKGEAEKIKIGSFPSLKDVIDQALAAGVEMYICEQSTQLLGIPRGDFIAEARIAGAGTLKRPGAGCRLGYQLLTAQRLGERRGLNNRIGRNLLEAKEKYVWNLPGLSVCIPGGPQSS